jgi:uncharacterized CHY-type Zn-finger protein
MVVIHGVAVKGVEVDSETRCKHYHTERDIIAIKFKCCDIYYPCHLCHEETAGHKAMTWSKEEWDEKAILCGECGKELTINEYMNSESICPNCYVSFNPGCQLHYHLYFEK